MVIKKADGFYALSEDGKETFGGPYRRRASAQLQEAQALPFQELLFFDEIRPRMDGQFLTKGPAECCSSSSEACYDL